MPHSIRPARQADTATIRRIADAVWPVAYRAILSPPQLAYMLELFYSKSALQEQMDKKGHHFFIAEGEGGAVGFASFSINGDTAHLHKLYVLPQTQGTGTGAALLLRCEDEAAQAGAAAMQLNVNRHNRAKDFYERHGYRVILEEDISIGHGYYMNDYRMEHTLTRGALEE